MTPLSAAALNLGAGWTHADVGLQNDGDGIYLSVGDEVASVDAGSAGTAIEGHPADVVLVALGVRPATGWLSDSGLEVSAEGAVLVDPAGRELGRLEGDADWDTLEGFALMRAAMAS